MFYRRYHKQLENAVFKIEPSITVILYDDDVRIVSIVPLNCYIADRRIYLFTIILLFV